MASRLIYEYWRFPVDGPVLRVRGTHELMKITAKYAGEFEESVEVCNACGAEDSVVVEYDGAEEPYGTHCIRCDAENPGTTTKTWRTKGQAASVRRDFGLVEEKQS